MRPLSGGRLTLAWTLLPLLAATPTPTPDPARVTSWAHQAFGDSAFVVDGFQPSSLTGDFNGDGAEDLALEEFHECMAVVPLKRKPKQEVPLAPPKAARGDSLFLATDAAEALLFWNGKTYRWYESPED